MNFLDHHYKKIRRFRFLWGWAKDSATKAKANARGAEWQAKGFRGAKLDVCGGRNPYKPGEFLNVDIADLPKVDVVFDITKRFPMEEGVIEEIFSAATLEHLRRPHVDHVLREFFRVLRPGGMLRVSTPDIEEIAKALLSKTENLETINQYFFGKYKSDDTEDYDLHRWMYPAADMMAALKKIGFERVEQIRNDVGLHHPTLNYMIRAFKPVPQR
jgi:predicted SAM-dependent methyltransferase